MSKLEVRIVELPPMRVVSVHGFGRHPEELAWRKLLAWARPRGLLDNPGERRIFGFNNPGPSAGSPNYGYEFWIAVGPEVTVEPGEEATIKEFSGGLYAVTRCESDKEGQAIMCAWKEFVAWREHSRYCYDGSHQWLEEHIGPADLYPESLTLDLYMPIAE